MKQKQKLIMFLFSGILILGVLSGCTDTSYEAPKPEPEPEPEPEPTYFDFTDNFSITISNTSGIDLIIESIDVCSYSNNSSYVNTGDFIHEKDCRNFAKEKSESLDKTIVNNKQEQIKFDYAYRSTRRTSPYAIKINCHYKGTNNLLTYPYVGSISETTVSKDYSSHSSSSYAKTNDTSFKSTGSLLLNFVKTDKNEYVLCVNK